MVFVCVCVCTCVRTSWVASGHALRLWVNHPAVSSSKNLFCIPANRQQDATLKDPTSDANAEFTHLPRARSSRQGGCRGRSHFASSLSSRITAAEANDGSLARRLLCHLRINRPPAEMRQMQGNQILRGRVPGERVERARPQAFVWSSVARPEFGARIRQHRGSRRMDSRVSRGISRFGAGMRQPARLGGGDGARSLWSRSSCRRECGRD